MALPLYEEQRHIKRGLTYIVELHDDALLSISRTIIVEYHTRPPRLLHSIIRPLLINPSPYSLSLVRNSMALH
jgi:hypothetical protein